MKAAGKRTAETRSTFERSERVNVGWRCSSDHLRIVHCHEQVWRLWLLELVGTWWFAVSETLVSAMGDSYWTWMSTERVSQRCCLDFYRSVHHRWSCEPVFPSCQRCRVHLLSCRSVLGQDDCQSPGNETNRLESEHDVRKNNRWTSTIV